MSDAPVPASGVPTLQPTSHAPRLFLLKLYNHNPFYVISALLMLFAVRNAYGRLEIGSINCWMMLGVLAGYTSLLGLIGILIVRLGKVWEDARSIFVVILLLFLAASVSMDDLFVKMETRAGGLQLLIGGCLFASFVTEAVFRGAGIRLGWLYRLPYHLLLALFFLAPWWVSPELHPRTRTQMEWLIILFPVASATLVLLLLPAVRRGPAYLAGNGTPWRWPLFPWIAYGVLIVAHSLRTFAMSMTFGPRGPMWIWIPMPSSSSGPSERVVINFDTMWGPYFLVPIAFAVLVLILEGSLATGNLVWQQRVSKWSPALLLLAYPLTTGPVFRDFLEKLTANVASPLWIAVVMLLLIQSRAWLAGVAHAGIRVLATVALFAVVSPSTMDVRSFTPIQPWPIALIGVAVLASGVWRRLSARQLAGVLLVNIAVRLALPDTILAAYRNTISFHVVWVAMALIGLLERDALATVLKSASAALAPIAGLLVFELRAARDVPLSWRIGYFGALFVVIGGAALVFRSRSHRTATIGLAGVAIFEFAAMGFRSSASHFGRAAMTSFLWSVALLLVGLLISAHKANWITTSLIRRRLRSLGLMSASSIDGDARSEQQEGGPGNA